jgi:hypothetical protein
MVSGHDILICCTHGTEKPGKVENVDGTMDPNVWFKFTLFLWGRILSKSI